MPQNYSKYMTQPVPKRHCGVTAIISFYNKVTTVDPILYPNKYVCIDIRFCKHKNDEMQCYDTVHHREFYASVLCIQFKVKL